MKDDLEKAIREHWEAGDHEAAAEVALRGYGPEVYRFLVLRMGAPDHADEVFAQLGEDLWKGLGEFQWRSSFSTWMYTLARNAASRYQRSPANQARRRENASRISDVVEEVRSRTEPYRRTSIKDRFAELRRRLPTEDQTLLLLRVSQRLSWNEVARVMEDDESLDGEALAKASSRMRQRFQKIKTRLRRFAEDEGLLENDE
ncbi:MAG: RNA polymerase sigma factor [Sandaracinaceae bacterium]